MNRFSEAYRKYQQLNEDYQSGRLDKDAFQSSVEELSFVDDQGTSWQIGVSSGEWYRLKDGEWIKDTPPSSSPQPGAPAREVLDTPPPPPPAGVDEPPPPPTSSFDEAPPIYDFGDPAEQPKKKNTKKKRRGCLIIGVILAVILACLGVIYVGNLILNNGEDLLYEFESSSWLGDEETYIVVDNQTSYDICGVYISPTTSDDWGSNWLSATESIGPYSTFSFQVTIGDTVDVYAENCQGEEMDTLFDLTIPEEGLTITYSPN